ncbi:MAG: ATP-binding protein [Cyanobacteria bacterium P01_F01_bin.56]
MSDSAISPLEQWHRTNEDYLAKALAWLRLRLLYQIHTVTDTKPDPDTSGPLDGLFAKRKPPPPEPTPPVSAADLTQAQERMAAAETAEPPPALTVLGQRLGLSRFEQQVLLLCAAMELDTRIARLCAQAQDNTNHPYPTFALALSIFADPIWDALSPERPLRYWRLLEINQPGAQPLTTSALRADERVVNYIKGLNYLDDRLAPLLTPLEVVNRKVRLPPSQQQSVEAVTNYLQQTLHQTQTPVIQLIGTDSQSKQLVAQQAAAQLDLVLYRLAAESLPQQTSEVEQFARLWQRESLLLPILLYLDAHEVDSGSNDTTAKALYQFLDRCHGLLFLSSREIQSQLHRANIPLDIHKPTALEQRSLWEKVLSDKAADLPAQLAGQFDLDMITMQQVLRRVQIEKAPNDKPLRDRLWEACLATTRPQMDLLAQRLDTKATWDDIVLPQEEAKLLRQIADQIRQRSVVYEDWGFHNRMNRGMGISALFAGESGTGKTMAAEVIANDLALNLYRIDLSAVVSKYIGETEKNLRRLFDAAEDGGAILFFDEADALFGKRSEVKDSHDRYANIEINYLLQRMEAFRGLAILATNMKGSLDHAFVRRLRFIVNFSFPGRKEREVIWQRVFPPETPVEALDWRRLARLNLTGGNIHNVAINAAFLAAQAKTPVTMPVALAAARTEYRKLGRPINEEDFRL